MSSGDFLNAIGTLRQIWRIGLNGPAILAIGDERFHVVNNDGSEYRPMAGANPVDPQDFVTKAYSDSIFFLMAPRTRLISTTEGVQGGGDLSVDRIHKLDINGLTEVLTIDPLADFLVMYDFSTGFHRKIKPQNLPSALIEYPIYFGAADLSPSTTTRYLYPGFDSSLAQAIEIGVRVTRPGILRNLFIVQNIPNGNGNNIVYTVRINGIDTLITVTMASTIQNASNTVNTVVVVAGDRVSIKVTKPLNIAVSPTDILATVEIT